jgi:hypothetical protein
MIKIFDPIVVSLLAMAPGNRVATAQRLQIMAFLLDRTLVKTGLTFHYELYPRSDDLAAGLRDALDLGRVKRIDTRRVSDGAAYDVFELVEDVPEILFESKGARRLIALCANTNLTILELATAIFWIARFEKSEDWRTEIKRRKPLKAEGVRLEKATALLQSLRLQY